MKRKRTPGKWYTREHFVMSSYRSKDLLVATCESLEDARLLGAAQELLDACIQAYHDTNHVSAARLRYAIIAATGVEP